MFNQTETFGAGEQKAYWVQGRYFNLLSCPSTCDVQFFTGKQAARDAAALAMPAGFWDSDPRGFTGFTIKSAGAGPVNFVASDGTSGVLRIAGTVTATIGQAAALSNIAAITVGVSAVSLLSANAARKVAYFRNNSGAAQVISLGPATVTVANAPIVLGVGQMYVDEYAAGAAWFGIASAAAGTLQVSDAQ